MKHKSLVPIGNPLSIRKKILRKNQFSLKKIGKFILIGLGVIIFCIALLFIWYAKDLPTPAKLKTLRPIESSKIMDKDGNVLYALSGDQKRTIIDFKDMPDSLKHGVIAAEDKDFYRHFGINIRSVFRAVIANVLHQSNSQGASTITQQFVKNALLSPEKTYSRKIKELILSLEIEVMYSKDQILEMYLNQIPYGSNIYGVQEAAKTYFGKDAKDLTLAESAVLASIPKAPTFYSPYGTHPDRLEARKDYVLDRMVDLKYITREDADKAKTEKIEFKPYRENISAPHFVMYVKEQLIDMFGEQMVTEGGLKVTTTLDPKKQEMAEQSIDESYGSITKNGATNAALVAVDPKNGQILAMVGSHDYFDTENDGQVNVAESPRQPGSSFKPIVYATAFKGKYNPASILFDLTTDFGNYTPHNYDGNTHGPVTIRQALSNSLNIPAVKMLKLAGIDESLKTASDMGITTLTNRDSYGLSLVLGGGEVKLTEMVGAYGTFANQGVYQQTKAITKVEDSHGKILYETKENKGKKDALDPQIAYEISNILSDNDARSMVFGARSALYFSDRQVAVKTGTTNGYRDAWTIGYTPSLVAGVWVGNNNNSPMNAGGSAAMVAAPVWHKFMQKALADTQNEEFTRPDGIQDLTVEKFSNKLPNSQSRDLIKDIFASWQVPTQSDDVDVIAKVDKSTNKLATDFCPSNLVEERVYRSLHSEIPDNPNWENPVRAWAEANGFGLGDPPTEKCDVHTSENQPIVTITEPTQDKTISGNFTISADIKSHYNIKYVEFFVDNISIGTDQEKPYSINYNANNLAAGTHQISARVLDEQGMSAKNSLSIKTIKDSTSPGDVSNVNINPGSKKLTISWKNPSDADLIKIRIYLSTTSGILGTLLSPEYAVNPNTTSSQIINDLSSGIKYYFTIHAVDSSNNENSSSTQYSATPL